MKVRDLVAKLESSNPDADVLIMLPASRWTNDLWSVEQVPVTEKSLEDAAIVLAPAQRVVES